MTNTCLTSRGPSWASAAPAATDRPSAIPAHDRAISLEDMEGISDGEVRQAGIQRTPGHRSPRAHLSATAYSGGTTRLLGRDEPRVNVLSQTHSDVAVRRSVLIDPLDRAAPRYAPSATPAPRLRPQSPCAARP